MNDLKLGSISRLLIIGLLWACGSKDERVKPKRMDITEAVYASGKIFPLDYYRINVSIPGYLKDVFVDVGDSVLAGQQLFTMKNEVTNFSVNTARNNLELARRNAADNSSMVNAMKQDIASARTRYELDSNNYMRAKSLIDNNIGTQAGLDAAEAQFKASKKQLEKAIANLNFNRDKLVNDVKNAQNLYDAQVTNKNDFTYFSSINGKVYDVIGKPGELINPQMTVMEIGRPDQFEVELQIDESDLNYVRVGQDVVFSSEPFPGTYFKGRIKKIYPKISQLSKSVKALSSIDLPDGIQIFAGATFEANIVVESKKNAMVIPRYFVRNDSVKVRRGGKTEKVWVVTGVQNIEFIEILSGITAEDEVVR